MSDPRVVLAVIAAGLKGGNSRACRPFERLEVRARLVEVPGPVPGLGEVVIKVGGAGPCHTDLHVTHDFVSGSVFVEPPFTLGHENAGYARLAAGDVVGRAVLVP